MLPEIGFYSLILACFISLLGFCTVFFKDNEKKNPYILIMGRSCVCSFVLLLISELVLLYSFVISDFSLLSVLDNSSINQSLIYKISSVWSFNRSSLLFITFLFSIIGAVFSIKKYKILKHDVFMLSSLNIINFIFSFLTIFVSNPFQRVFHKNTQMIDGTGLNPVLQNPIAVIHPPLIFITYAICLYIAVCSIGIFFTKTKSVKLLKEIKKYSFFGVVFCSMAILSGAYWAYDETGWGGYWSWDPVECSALINWLLLVCVSFLCISNFSYKKIMPFLGTLTFASCIGGTALIRSGLLSSVHAYTASSPKKIISFFVVLLIYAIPAYLFYKTFDKEEFIKKIKEKYVFISFLSFVCSVIVAIGVYYPAFSNLQLIKSGYYKLTLMPILLIAVFQFCNVKKNLKKVKNSQGKVFYLCLVICICSSLFFIDIENIDKSVLFLTFLICFICVLEGIFSFNKDKLKTMILISLSVFILSSSSASVFEKHKTKTFALREKARIFDYEFFFADIKRNAMDNYRTMKGIFIVSLDNNLVGVLAPEKRHYGASNISTLEIDKISHILSNIKISINAPDEEGRYVVNVSITPFYSLYWLSSIVFMLGLIFLIVNKGYDEKL